MASLYIVVILLCRVVQAFFNKRSSNVIQNHTVLMGFSAFQSAVSALLGIGLIVMTDGGFSLDWPTAMIAAFSGVSLFFSITCGIYAMKSGTVSLSSMFGTAGMIIPIAAGAFLFDKPVAPMQLVGVFIFFVSAYLLIGASKTIYTNFSYKTLFWLIGSLVANGCTMLTQQMFTVYVPYGNVSVFSFLSFAIIAVLSGIFYGVSASRHTAKQEDTQLSRTLIVCGVALAAAVFVINQLATICTKLVSPVILFTFINGGGTIISALVAAVIYQEKLSKKTIIGIVLGIASLIIIKVFEQG